MALEVTILGVSSASPAYGRNPTSQVVSVKEELILLDCGEGTQMQLRRFKQRFSKLNTILISHLHGDHFFGLPGLLSSFHLLGRKNPLDVYGPPLLESMLEVLFAGSETHLGFELRFHPLQPDFSGEFIRNKKFTVEAYPLSHSQPCHGFVIREIPPLRNLIKTALDAHGVETCDYLKIKQGHDWISSSGEVVPVDKLAHPPKPAASYGFFTDTRPISDLGEKTGPLSCLYHESTFLHDLLDRAVATRHSTAKEAALMAKAWKAQTLLLGHYSGRYGDLLPLRDEARAVFPITHLALEGMVMKISAEETLIQESKPADA